MDERAAPPSPQPARRIIASRAEYLAAFDELLAGARMELRIFDPDLAQLGLNAPERAERMRQFMLAGRENRVYIALHDIDYVTRSAPRVMSLLTQFSANIAVHRTEDDAARAQDCFVLVDAEHMVRRPVAAQPRGVFVAHDLKECQAIRDRFDEIWQSSVPAVSATQLGL
ncbi:MAG: hypothetical protein KJ025_09100 [Burkholderiales bacterium]|nr:hypothetical protein [Burkholderiales bacterium]